MSRARTLAGAIGSDGALNVADVAGLAAVASSGSASDLSTGTLPIARIADGAVTPAKLSTGAPSWASNGTMTLGSLASVGVEATPNSSGMRVNNWGNAGLPNAASETYVYDNQATTTSKEVTYDVSRLSGDLNTGMRELYTKSGSTWYNTLRLRNGIVELPQGQLKFPVSQNASSDANTLDDYEEGTWTPSFLGTGSNPTVTYNGAQGGTYTKIGRLVVAQCYFRFSSFTGGSGAAVIGGLPFASSASNLNGVLCASEWSASFPSSATYPYISGESNGSGPGTFIYLIRSGPGVAGVNIQVSNFTSTDTYLLFTFSYFT